YVVANYLAWRVVELMGPLTVERMRRCRFRFDRYRYSLFELPPLSRECYEFTARYMKFAVAKILYDQEQEKTIERQKKVRLVAEEVKDAFAVWLDLATWMTESNKKLAAFKARSLLKRFFTTSIFGSRRANGTRKQKNQIKKVHSGH
ncbi:hypothetical protein MTO96_030239, partial [Rhipicephalus appendiculatus]